MASPQTERGFVMIALDLFVGLMTSGLPDNDSILLTWILLQSYGPHKRKDIHLDFAEIEEYTGMHRNNARASAKSLVLTGYLRRNDDGSYRFLKDWESFRPKRGAFVDRLNGGLKRFAKAALTHDKFIKKCKPEAIQPNCPDSSKVNSTELPVTSVGNSVELGSCSEGQFSRIASDAYTLTQNGDVTSNNRNGLRRPLAGERVRASEELEIERGIASQSKLAGERTDGGPLMTAEELIAQVEADFGKPALTAEVKRNLGSIIEKLGDRLDCFLAGLKQAKRSRTRINNVIGFAIYQGTTYRRTGIPPEPMAFVPEVVVSKSKPNNYDDILAGMED